MGNFITSGQFGSYIPAVPENFGKFLEELLEDLGVRPSELADLVGRRERTVYNWIHSVEAPVGALPLISDALHIPLLELRKAASGRDNLPTIYRERQRWRKLVTDASAPSNGRGKSLDESRIVQAGPRRLVPLYRGVSAVRKDLRDDQEVGKIETPGGIKGDFAVVLDGQCMEPVYPDGVKVVCSVERWKSEGFIDGKDYWVRFSDNESTFKRVHIRDDDHDVLIMQPLNPKMKNWTVHRRAIALAARATGVILD